MLHRKEMVRDPSVVPGAGDSLPTRGRPWASETELHPVFLLQAGEANAMGRRPIDESGNSGVAWHRYSDTIILKSRGGRENCAGVVAKRKQQCDHEPLHSGRDGYPA
jgi:hypothetical protein